MGNSSLPTELLLYGYSIGVFPMGEERKIRFYEPQIRALIPLEFKEKKRNFHIPKRLLRKVLHNPFKITFNMDFQSVIKECASIPRNNDGGWINKEIIDSYTDLYKAGYAHSIEVWDNEKLIGGLYGVALGAAFFGESMFSKANDASKIALVHLVANLKNNGFILLDAQFPNPHLNQFGAYEVTKKVFKEKLENAIKVSLHFHPEQNSFELVKKYFF